jgi:diguanylate cyclase (GGDEF)-like protein/PAS domain S-box-containing protein
VIVEMDSARLLNQTWYQLTTTLQIILAGLLFNSLLMYLILRGSLSPLQKLVEGEHKFAEGNLDTRLVEVGCPEVRQLISEFNQMAQHIEAQTNKSALDARQLRESEHHFRTLANNASVLIWMSGTDKLCNYFNQVWLEFTGRSLDKETGNGWTEAVHPEDLQRSLAVYTQAFDQRQPFDMEYRLRRHDGEYRWLIDHGVPRYDIQGEFLGYVGSCLDITDRKQIEIDISNSLHALRTRDYALAQISQGVVIASPQRRITYVNDGFEKLTGYRAAELMGKSCSILQGKDTDPETISSMRSALDAVKPFRGVILNYHKDGTEFWNDLSITPVFDDQGVLSQFVSVQHDITAHKRDEEMIRQLAFFDSLTQLANRRLLNDRLDRAIALSKRSTCYGALIYLDLDNFKPLNDSCGHEVGDRLLIEVAARLKLSTREADTVARIGGDEFAVLLVELDPKLDVSIKQTSIVAEKIRANIAEPYLLDLQTELGQNSQKVEHRCTSSIGVALFANDDHSQVELFRRADMAMYQAKQNGRNQIQFFTTVI